MTLAPESFKGTPVEGFIFEHKQWVVTKNYKHVMPVMVSDPADETNIATAMLPYEGLVECMLTNEQHDQWMKMIREYRGNDHWFCISKIDNSLVHLGEFPMVHEAEAEHFKQTSPLNLNPRALIRWPYAYAWTHVN